MQAPSGAFFTPLLVGQLGANRKESMSATVVTSENLAEFQAARMAQTSAPDPEPIDEIAETETVATEGTPPAPEDEAQQQEEQKPENKKVQKRIDELTKQREDARRDTAKEREAREALEARVKDLEAKPNPQAAPKADSKPAPAQFNDAYEYAEALAEWSAEQALVKRDAQEAERKAAVEREKIVSEWSKRQTDMQTEVADYDDVIASSTVAVSDQVRDAILESDIGPKILYHLAKNPDIAASLASKSVTSALREIGRLEATLTGPQASAKPAATPSRAPSPITPINATRSADSPVDSKGEFFGTFADYKAARSAGKIR